MTRHPLAWLPPFLVGIVGVVAAEVAVGLLLYSGAGFLRALTVILVTLLGSLALGLWTAPRSDLRGRDPGLTEAIRRRWLLSLVAFVAAAAAAGAWELLGGLATAAATRGLGLALLAGLPLYAVGTLLGAMERGRIEPDSGVAPFVALGGMAGAFLAGVVLLPALIPVTALVLCVVLLSGAALLEGQILDRRAEDRVVDEEASVRGPVRVVDREWGDPRRSRRLLEVGGREVGGWEDREPLRPWETGVLDLLLRRVGGDPGGGEEGGAVLVVGGAAPGLIRQLREGGAPLVVVEPDPVIRRILARHFDLPLRAPGLRIEAAGAEGRIRPPPGGGSGWRAVVVDPWGVGHPGGVGLPHDALCTHLARGRAPDAPLILGVDDPAVLGSREVRGAIRTALEACGVEDRKVTVYGGEDDGGSGALVVGGGGLHPPEVGGLRGRRLHPAGSRGATAPPGAEPPAARPEGAPDPAEVAR
jgi:hypothetical protein